MTSDTECTAIDNCADEVNDEIGTACNECSAGYYMTSDTACTARPDSNCALETNNVID